MSASPKTGRRNEPADPGNRHGGVDSAGGSRNVRRPDPCLQQGTYVDGVVHLVAQLAEALQHTHQAGICHRDLKPSNVLLTPSGCPMLLDFNLSSDTQLEQTFVGGTLPYMAPEDLRSMTTRTRCRMPTAIPAGICFPWASSCMNC